MTWLRFLLRRMQQPAASSKPLLLSVTVTAPQLAEAWHFVDNNGRMRLFGTPSCPHLEKAEKVLEHLLEKERA